MNIAIGSRSSSTNNTVQPAVTESMAKVCIMNSNIPPDLARCSRIYGRIVGNGRGGKSRAEWRRVKEW